MPQSSFIRPVSTPLYLPKTHLKHPKKPKVAFIDGDGVLVNYNTHYAQAWTRAFGTPPTLTNPTAYHAIQVWNVPHLPREQLDILRSNGFDHHHWRTMPAMPGAIEATKKLHHAGWTLICLTALDPEFAQARLENLQNLGMPITKVIATGFLDGNPKADHLKEHQPDLFIDDYGRYFTNLDGFKGHKALIHGTFHDSPNHHYLETQPHLFDSIHPSLLDCVNTILKT